MNNYEKRFREFLEENCNNIELIGDFKNLTTKTLFIDHICGHEFEVMPVTIKNYVKSNGTYRHRDCNPIEKQKLKEMGKRRNAEAKFKALLDSTNGEYIMLPDLPYVDNKTKVKLKHTVCGHEWYKIPKDFMHKGNRCPKCSGRLKDKNTDMYKDEVYELVGDEYTVLGEYTKNDEYIKMRHNTCGNEYDVMPTNFLHGGCRCPNCVQISRNSKGIRKIKKVLDENSIQYLTEVQFDDLYTTSEFSCRKYKLSFDIQVYDKNNNKVLIEYDGRQHLTGWNGNKEDLAKNIRNDKMKDDYCKANNIKLIRIPESKFSKISNILEDNNII